MPANDPNNFELFKFLWAVLLVPLGWLGINTRGNSKDVRTLEKEIADHKLFSATHYVKNSDLKDMENRILMAIAELKTDVKNKVDR